MQWFARVTLVDGSRPWVELDPSISETDRAGAQACAQLVSHEARESGAVTSIETVSEYAKRWLEAREESGYTSVAADRSRMGTHILPVLGAKDVRKVTRAELEDLVDALDRRVRAGSLSWKSARHIWSLVSKMFDDAHNAKRRTLRVRADNPAAGVHAPDRGPRKAKVYLWPSEFLQLVSCEDVPLRWRRFFTITAYLFARVGEINALDWSDVDLEHRTVHIHKSVDRNTGVIGTTKTEKGRKVPIEPALMPLLEAMHEESGGKGAVSPIRATDRKLSRQLQRCLRIAGVERADLFASDAMRKPITAHDLRATGITWAAVRRDGLEVIAERAGHEGSYDTTRIYIREAENLRGANFGQPFPPLPPSLMVSSEFRPRTKPQRGRAAIQAETSGGAGNRSQPENAAKDTGEAVNQAAPRDPLAAVRDDSSVRNPNVEDVDIENAIVRAVLDGRVQLADMLRDLLERRRQERAGNVVPLARRR